jgi:hypothetical protein
MPKKLKSTKQSVDTLSKGPRSGIVPFTERPSEERSQAAPGTQGGLHASELFSLFTANIIKEEKLFTR